MAISNFKSLSNFIRHHYLLIITLIIAAILRFYHLSSNPPALYWDEASIGYNAYSILTAGIDEHGTRFPLTHFLAYGDAKPPLYIYATTASMAVFGVNEFAVRFPSALAGSLAVLITFFLTRHLFPHDSPSCHKRELGGVTINSVPLISSLLLAISPWHLQMSRAGFEANLALTLFLAGFLFFLKSLHRPRLLPLSAILFVSTLYTFNAYRIFLPLFLVLLLILYRRPLIKHLRWVIVSLVFASALTAPLIPFILSNQAKLRFNEVTIFNNHAPIIEANLRQQLNHNTFWSKLIHNRRLLFALDFLAHYTDHFKPDFLFFSGDVNPRLSTRDQGMLYIIELPLFLFGLYHLTKRKSPSSILIITWLLLAFVPAGVARETPHALRSLQALPTFQIIIAFGLLHLYTKYNNKIFKSFLIISYSFLIIFYLDTYHFHYANHWSASWQYGYKQLVQYVANHQDQYDKIYITKKLGRPHTYFLFYLQYDPRLYIQNRDAGGDAYGFTYTNSFDKYYFTNPDLSSKPTNENWLIISGADAIPHQTHLLHSILDPGSNAVFIISEL